MEELPSFGHVDLLGIVPLSWVSIVVVALGLVLTAVVLRPVVAATGWQRWPTASAGAALTAILGLTLGSVGNFDVVRGPGCLLLDESVVHVFIEAGHNLESALNAVLLVPLGLALVLASRRALPALLVVLVLPGVVEVAQLALPGRVCSLADYLLNVAGGVVGVGLGTVAVRRSRLAGPR